MCNMTNPSNCTQCATGFVLQGGVCQACASYCANCKTPTQCNSLLNSIGYVLISISQTSNTLAACDPGCVTCLPSNPSICSVCATGYYLVSSSSNCLVCTAASQCATCSPATPSTCLSCNPGFFLNTLNACVQCQYPCTACGQQNANSCTACAIGYALSNNTCIYIGNSNDTQVMYCANAFVVNNTITCTLCLQGYTFTSSGCAPCSLGCLVCNANNLISCVKCAPGYFLNPSSFTCNLCQSTGCTKCTLQGCTACAPGFILNQFFICQLNCLPPCAACTFNSLICFTCLLGYSLVNGHCISNISCNSNANCLACPYGYSLVINNVNSKINQTCAQCTATICARCSPTNLSQCLSCPMGYYLNSSQAACDSCSTGCAICLSSMLCTTCSVGYVPLQSGTLLGNINSGIVNCTACAFPCASCTGSPTTCTTCPTGFTINGAVCMSNFNYQVLTVLSVNLTQFQPNYISFLNQIANAAGVGVQNIVVLSISSGSINILTRITSNFPPGSSNAVNAQNSINNLLSSGTVGNMAVSTFSITTNGGSNDNGDNNGGGLSTTTIIILATVIPIGTLRIYTLIKSSSEPLSSSTV